MGNLPVQDVGTPPQEEGAYQHEATFHHGSRLSADQRMQPRQHRQHPPHPFQFFGMAGGRKAEYCGRYPRLMI